jgi:branched-subunit amino acid ABC-type transport system permease component
VGDLVSNGAYLVMAALAWNLKAWFAPLVPDRARGLELLKMEFRSFLQVIVLLPCQIVLTARRIVWRILSYHRWLSDLFATFGRIVALEAG